MSIEQHLIDQGHDPILMALREGFNAYVRKYERAPGRQYGSAFVYDRGVLEGMRWCIDTYEEMSNR